MGKDNGTFLRSLDAMDGRDLLAAVITARDRFTAEGKKPGAEKWTGNTAIYRPLMVAAVRSDWCKRTGKEDYEFPWSSDHVAREWVDWRKTGREKKAAVRDLLLNESAA